MMYVFWYTLWYWILEHIHNFYSIQSIWNDTNGDTMVKYTYTLFKKKSKEINFRLLFSKCEKFKIDSLTLEQVTKNHNNSLKQRFEKFVKWTKKKKKRNFREKVQSSNLAAKVILEVFYSWKELSFWKCMWLCALKRNLLNEQKKNIKQEYHRKGEYFLKRKKV